MMIIALMITLVQLTNTSGLTGMALCGKLASKMLMAPGLRPKQPTMQQAQLQQVMCESLLHHGMKILVQILGLKL